MGRVAPEQVVVFIDWQNLYKGARDAFHQGQGSRLLGNVQPVRLAQRLVQLSPGRRRELRGVRIYRGQPDPTRDPRGFAANRRQQDAWQALAVDFVMLAVVRVYDVGILVSTDTDLVPALEAVVGLGGNRGPRAEVAAWTSSRAAPRLRVTQARLWCHYLRVDDYRGMVDPTDYTSR
jgi:hypothetical protein